MTKTKIQKALAIIALVALGIANVVNTYAVQIGTGSVTGDSGFDTVINWDGTFTATSASGSVTGIVVTATVDPVLDMEISTGAIDLGTLVSGIASTGSLEIEVGTNAVNGVTITARSGSGGLTNTSDNSIQINNLVADGVQENYTFSSIDNAINDSSYGDFASTGDLASIEVTDNSTEHTIYSTNRPETETGIDDVTFSVAAEITAETPAGNYQDTVTFTVTGNF